jgi:hypothetical protein
MATNVKELLPPNLRNEFWTDFADSVSEELIRFKNRVKEKEILYDVSSLNNKDDLVEIAKSLGYTPDLSLDNSLQNIKENVNAVTFRIQNKSSYLSYEYIFKTIPYAGEVFILYYEDDKLQRAAINILEMLGDLGSSDQPYNEPFTYEAEENYSQYLFSTLFLDTGLRLDSSSRPWALDESTSSSKTNHIAVEYALNRIITQDGTEYLMTPDYLGYLFNGVQYTRKVTEVPHVGSQLSLIMDPSGFYDKFSDGNDSYSIPDLKLRCAVTDQYVTANSADNAYRLVAGTGTTTLPSVNDGSPTWPTELANQVVDSILVDDETDEIQDWKIVNTMLPANTITNETLGIGTGDVFSASGSFNISNIKPYSVRINFISSPFEYTIVDDGQGRLFVDGVTDYPIGSVDYEAGTYNFATEKKEDIDLEVLSEISVSNIDTNLAHTLVEPGTFFLYFKIGETGFIKQDDGGGNFVDVSTGLVSGSVDYTSGAVEAVFQSSTASREANADEHGNIDGGVTAEYQFTRQYEVDNGSTISADYEVTEPLPLTEAGLKDVDGNLLAYGTFPPISMDDVRYHASFQFLIKKSAFDA